MLKFLLIIVIWSKSSSVDANDILFNRTNVSTPQIPWAIANKRKQSNEEERRKTEELKHTHMMYSISQSVRMRTYVARVFIRVIQTSRPETKRGRNNQRKKNERKTTNASLQPAAAAVRNKNPKWVIT